MRAARLSDQSQCTGAGLRNAGLTRLALLRRQRSRTKARPASATHVTAMVSSTTTISRMSSRVPRPRARRPSTARATPAQRPRRGLMPALRGSNDGRRGSADASPCSASTSRMRPACSSSHAATQMSSSASSRGAGAADPAAPTHVGSVVSGSCGSPAPVAAPAPAAQVPTSRPSCSSARDVSPISMTSRPDPSNASIWRWRRNARGEGGGAFAHVGRLLEPLLGGQRPHASFERFEQSSRFAAQSDHGLLDDGAVALGGDRARTGARRHAELRRRARPRPRVATRGRGAAPERHRALDRLGHAPRLRGGRERTEVERAVVAYGAHDRQPREGLAEGELEVAVARPVLRLAVEARLVLVDETDFGDRGLERARAHLMVDGVHLAQQLTDLPATVAGEVGAHPRSQVGGLAHVEHAPTAVTEEVDARRAGERSGERQLRDLGVPRQLGQGEEVVEPGDAEPAGPFEQDVQQIGRGQGVVEGPMVGPVVEAQPGGERAETAVGHLVAHEPAGQSARVDPRIGEPRTARPLERHP